MSQIVDFFINNGTDHAATTLEDIVNFNDEALEYLHDVVQWCFPLHEASTHFLSAPVLTKNDVETLQKSDIAVANMRKILSRWRKFYFQDPYPWCKDKDHNLLRITRIIRSLRLFGLEADAWEFYIGCMAVAKDKKINQTTLDFWKAAMMEPIWDTLSKPVPKMTPEEQKKLDDWNDEKNIGKHDRF